MEGQSIVPRWFTIAMVVALVWNLMGVLAVVGQSMMTAEDLARLPQEQQALHAKTPLWANIAFGFGVIGGFLGCIAMLLKKSIASLLFTISLVGVIAQMTYAFLFSDSLEVFGPGSMLMPTMVILIAAWLLVFSKKCQKQCWIS